MYSGDFQRSMQVPKLTPRRTTGQCRGWMLTLKFGGKQSSPVRMGISLDLAGSILKGKYLSPFSNFCQTYLTKSPRIETVPNRPIQRCLQNCGSNVTPPTRILFLQFLGYHAISRFPSNKTLLNIIIHHVQNGTYVLSDLI